MKKIRAGQKYQEFSGNGISLTRKVLVWTFIIGFWVFFYWYKGQGPNSPNKHLLQEEMVNHDNRLPRVNSDIDKASKDK